MYMMPWELFGFLRFSETVYKLNGADWLEVAKQDPRRIVLEFAFSLNPTGFRLSCRPVASAVSGKFIASGLSPLVYVNTSHAILTQTSWQAFSLGGAADVVVTEVFLDREPCKEQT